MAAAGLAKYKNQVESMKRSAATKRARAKSEQIEETAVGAAVAYGVGRIETSTELPTILGLDGKIVWGMLFAVVSTTTSGRASRWLASGADGMLLAASYEAGKGELGP